MQLPADINIQNEFVDILLEIDELFLSLQPNNDMKVLTREEVNTIFILSETIEQVILQFIKLSIREDKDPEFYKEMIQLFKQ